MSLGNRKDDYPRPSVSFPPARLARGSLLVRQEQLRSNGDRFAIGEQVGEAQHRSADGYVGLEGDSPRHRLLPTGVVTLTEPAGNPGAHEQERTEVGSKDIDPDVEAPRADAFDLG